MFSYLSTVPATNSSVVLAMMVASLLPLVFAILAKVFGGFKSKDNANPREFLGKQTGAAARANAAQQNSYETLLALADSLIRWNFRVNDPAEKNQRLKSSLQILETRYLSKSR